MTIQNKAINYLASSCLAIYLIGSSGFFFRHWIKDGAMWIQEMIPSISLQIVCVFVLGLVVVAACIAIDKLLTPIWRCAALLGEKMEQTKIGRILTEYGKYE